MTWNPKPDADSLLAGYYHLAHENRKLDTEGNYMDAVILLHRELTRIGTEYKFPI